MILHDVLRALTVEERAVFLPIFRRAVMVKAQNVADYFMCDPNKNWNLDKDFPNCAPPWPLFWMEWKQPIEGGGRADMGILVEAEKFHKGDDPAIQGWSLKGTLFFPWLPQAKIATLYAILDQEGRHVPDTEEDDRQRDNRKLGIQLFSCTSKEEERQSIAQEVNRVFFVVWLAISFCHCRNVTVDEHTTPHKLVKAQERRGRLPVLSYYTLAIAPMVKVLTACAPSGVSLQKRLHICRGHFKDYRQGGGLFGKQKGLYWWDMNLRGNSAKGAIVKDYAISP